MERHLMASKDETVGPKISKILGSEELDALAGRLDKVQEEIGRIAALLDTKKSRKQPAVAAKTRAKKRTGGD
jgi:hypothetical protein